MIKIVGGALNGSRLPMPGFALKDGMKIKLRDGRRYVVVDADSGWEAHLVDDDR